MPAMEVSSRPNDQLPDISTGDVISGQRDSFIPCGAIRSTVVLVPREGSAIHALTPAGDAFRLNGYRIPEGQTQRCPTVYVLPVPGLRRNEVLHIRSRP